MTGFSDLETSFWRYLDVKGKQGYSCSYNPMRGGYEPQSKLSATTIPLHAHVYHSSRRHSHAHQTVADTVAHITLIVTGP